MDRVLTGRLMAWLMRRAACGEGEEINVEFADKGRWLCRRVGGMSCKGCLVSRQHPLRDGKSLSRRHRSSIHRCPISVQLQRATAFKTV